MSLTPLTGGNQRRRTRSRVLLILGIALSFIGTAAMAVAGIYVGQNLGGELDRPTVVTAGLPSGALSADPEQESTPAPAIDFSNVRTIRPRLKSPPRAGLLLDVESGEALWSRNASEALPVASLTKIMSALLVVERTSARERAKVTRTALRYSGSGVGVLPRGKRVPVDGLLSGMLLVSGNDASIALAEHIAGSERAFVRMMNERAAQLGLRCTHFTSPHGLENSNRSCASDLAALSRLAMEQPRIARIVRRRQLAPKFPIRGGRLFLNSTNPLLRLRYPGTIGLKTGYTQRAGHSYVGVVRRGERTLGLVLLNSRDTGSQAREIFDRAFRDLRRR